MGHRVVPGCCLLGLCPGPGARRAGDLDRGVAGGPVHPRSGTGHLRGLGDSGSTRYPAEAGDICRSLEPLGYSGSESCSSADGCRLHVSRLGAPRDVGVDPGVLNRGSWHLRSRSESLRRHWR
jgi:hypothetical protein